MAVILPIQFGPNCNFSATLGYTVVGRVSFTFDNPYLYLIDAGKNFPGPLDGFIKIYDCSDPSGITLVSTTATPFFSGPEDPRITGNILVLPYRRPNTPAQATTAGVPGQEPQLSCWDISDKSNPTQLGALNMGYNSVAGEYNKPVDAQIIGDTVCCAIGFSASSEADAAFVDISDPSNPTLTLDYKNASSLQNFFMLKTDTHFFLIGIQGSGGTAFVLPLTSSGTAGTKLLASVSGDTLSSCAISGDGNRIFITYVSGRFWVVDVSTPMAPATISLTLPFSTLPSDGNAMVVVPQTNRLYVGGLGIGGFIYILDTTNTTPTIVGGFTTANTPLELVRLQAACAGFAYTEFGGTDVTLLGTAPLS